MLSEPRAQVEDAPWRASDTPNVAGVRGLAITHDRYQFGQPLRTAILFGPAQK